MSVFFLMSVTEYKIFKFKFNIFSIIVEPALCNMNVKIYAKAIYYSLSFFSFSIFASVLIVFLLVFIVSS